MEIFEARLTVTSATNTYDMHLGLFHYEYDAETYANKVAQVVTENFDGVKVETIILRREVRRYAEPHPATVVDFINELEDQFDVKED